MMQIESPDHLWQLFLSYKKDVKDNPFKQQYFTAKGKEKYHDKERPLFLSSFRIYAWDVMKVDTKNHFINRDNRFNSYTTVCTKIKDEIKKDHQSGVKRGVFNKIILRIPNE